MIKLTHSQRCELIIILRDLLLERGYRLNASRQSAYNWATHKLAPSPERLFAALMFLGLVAPDADLSLVARLRPICPNLTLHGLVSGLAEEIVSRV